MAPRAPRRARSPGPASGTTRNPSSRRSGLVTIALGGCPRPWGTLEGKVRDAPAGCTPQWTGLSGLCGTTWTWRASARAAIFSSASARRPGDVRPDELHRPARQERPNSRWCASPVAMGMWMPRPPWPWRRGCRAGWGPRRKRGGTARCRGRRRLARRQAADLDAQSVVAHGLRWRRTVSMASSILRGVRLEVGRRKARRERGEVPDGGEPGGLMSRSPGRALHVCPKT